MSCQSLTTELCHSPLSRQKDRNKILTFLLYEYWKKSGKPSFAGGGVVPNFYLHYKGTDFYVFIDLFDPKQGPKSGKITELHTLEDLSYGQAKRCPSDMFERLKAHTRDIIEIIRDLKEEKSKVEELKDDYERLSKHRDREHREMQEVIENYRERIKKLKYVASTQKKKTH